MLYKLHSMLHFNTWTHLHNTKYFTRKMNSLTWMMFERKNMVQSSNTISDIYIYHLSLSFTSVFYLYRLSYHVSLSSISITSVLPLSSTLASISVIYLFHLSLSSIPIINHYHLSLSSTSISNIYHPSLSSTSTINLFSLSSIHIIYLYLCHLYQSSISLSSTSIICHLNKWSQFIYLYLFIYHLLLLTIYYLYNLSIISLYYLSIWPTSIIYL